MDKFDKQMISVAPDGKSEIIPGNEPLQKLPGQPKKKKKPNKDGIVELRWKDLKKALDNAKAILDLREESKDDEEPENEQQKQQQQQQPPEDNEEQPEDTEEAGDQEQPQDSGVTQTTAAVPERGENIKQAATQRVSPDEMKLGKNDEDADGDAEEQGSPDDDAEAEKIRQQMKDAGYSDAEIAFVIDGHHSPEVDAAKDAKAKATHAMSDIDTNLAQKEGEEKLAAFKDEAERKAKTANDEAALKLEHARKMAELELSHKQRMAELEYEKSKREMPDAESDKKHKQRMSDLEYESKKSEMSNPDHKRRMEDVEYESSKAGMPNNETEVAHKKRMLDLEYQMEKEAMKLEIEFKKKEHELKLKLAEDASKQKKVESDAKHKVRLSDAKKPQPKKPLKKSDESLEDSDEVEGQPYNGEEHHDFCDNPSCDKCYVDGQPYEGHFNKDEELPYWSKRSKQIQGYRNQVNDALRARKIAAQTASSNKPPVPLSTTGASPRPQYSSIGKPPMPKIPAMKTDSSDPSANPTFKNKAQRAQQRTNREDAEEETHDLVAKPDSVMQTKYVDVGTRPTPATPTTHPKLR